MVRDNNGGLSRQQLIYLIINAQRTAPENGSFVEHLADFLLGYGVMIAPNHTPSPRWVSVAERLPDEEAKEFIQNKLNGIGSLYPCLLAYRSPYSGQIHVVTFYYDIAQKWFVNSGEKLCERDRCFAWMSLPELPEGLLGERS